VRAIDWFPLLLSFRVALLATALTAVLGVGGAYALARIDFPGRGLVEAVAADTGRLRVNDAVQRNHGHFRSATTNVEHHRAARFLHGQAGSDRGGHRLADDGDGALRTVVARDSGEGFLAGTLNDGVKGELEALPVDRGHVAKTAGDNLATTAVALGLDPAVLAAKEAIE
jgi:hypothetical protein